MILVTHIDLDGVGCQLVTKWFCHDLTAVYNLDYDVVDKKVRKLLEKTDEKIMIADVSINQETAQYAVENYPGRIELFDHHKTAQEYLGQYNWTLIDLEHSATKILFKELSRRNPDIKIPEGLKKLVFHVNDHDLWIHESKESKKYNDMLFMLGIKEFAKIMEQRIAEDKELMDDADKRYLKGLSHTKQGYIQAKIKQAKIHNNRLVVLASKHISELCDYVRTMKNPPKEWKDIDYVDVVNLEQSCHSLRSYNQDFDVSKIAKENGGGGHPKAAGYPINLSENFVLQF